jgi:AcrR family transcriptional regulator
MTDQAQAARESIVRAAGVVFSGKDYDRVTIDDLLVEADVSRSALDAQFESKKAVALEVIARQHQLFIDTGRSLLEEDIRGVRAMIMLSRELALHITTNPLVRAGLRLSTESADVFVETASGPYDDWIRTCEVFIRRAAHEGDITADYDPERLAAFVIATFTGVQSLSLARTMWADLFDRLEEMWSFLFAGMAARGGSTGTIDIRGILRGE